MSAAKFTLSLILTFIVFIFPVRVNLFVLV